MNGSIYVSDSRNVKIAGLQKVDATYTSIEVSCPKTCPLKGEGCYAEMGPTGIHSSRLDRESEGLSALDVARSEAKAIDSSYESGPVPTGRMLRLHVSGDSRTLAGTRVINNSIGRWKKRGGGDCWSYTHAWKTVPRSEWSNVSILASITDTSEVQAARKQGYAPAIVVAEHLSERAYTLEGSDVKWIPCPAQTRDVACSECKLCFNADRLLDGNFGIAFSVHGVKKEVVKRKHLAVIK